MFCLSRIILDNFSISRDDAIMEQMRYELGFGGVP